MDCPSELTCSMYADGALPAPEAAAFADHLAGCARCHTLVAAFAAEGRLLAARLEEADTRLEGDAHPVWSAPDDQPPLSRAARLAFAACAAALSWGISSVWIGLATVTIPGALRWVDPGRIPGLFLSFVIFLANEGYAMFVSMIDAVSLGMLLLLAGAVLVSILRNRGARAARLSLCLAAVCLLFVAFVPSVSHAVEVRRADQTLTIPAGEVVDDTLIVLGESVAIDGTVNGDLIALARRVIVRGTVGGNLITAGESVTVQGEVGGSVLGFARSLDLPGASIGRNVFGFARDVSTSGATAIDANAIVFCESATLNGSIGADLLAFGDNLELGGQVTEDVLAYAGHVLLLASAHVGGDLTAHTSAAENVQVLPGAAVAGTVDTHVPERVEPRTEYLMPSYYLGQVMRLAAALVTGLVLLWLLPGLRELPLRTGAQVLRAAAYGIVTVAALPVLAVILMVTLIGIPLGLLVLVLWLIALYVAKIVLAGWMGQLILDMPERRHHVALVLLVGLVVVLILVNIPIVGGVLNALMTLVGLGLLAGYVLRQWPSDQRIAEP